MDGTVPPSLLFFLEFLVASYLARRPVQAVFPANLCHSAPSPLPPPTKDNDLIIFKHRGARSCLLFCAGCFAAVPGPRSTS